MTSDDVDRVHRIIEAFNGDCVEELLEHLDPDIEWHVPDILPEQSVYHGHDGVRDLVRTMRDSFDDFRVEIEETIDAGDRVMLLAAMRGRGKESGIEVESPSFGWVWTLRDGKALLLEVYPNRAQTLQALDRVRPPEGTA